MHTTNARGQHVCSLLFRTTRIVGTCLRAGNQTKKRLLLVLELVAIPLVGGIYLWFVFACTPLEPQVTMENIYRLHKGMTQEEVEAILGEPSQPYAERSLPYGLSSESYYKMTGKIEVCAQWKQKGSIVNILFVGDKKSAPVVDGYNLGADDGVYIILGERPKTYIEQILEFVGFSLCPRKFRAAT